MASDLSQRYGANLVPEKHEDLQIQPPESCSVQHGDSQTNIADNITPKFNEVKLGGSEVVAMGKDSTPTTAGFQVHGCELDPFTTPPRRTKSVKSPSTHAEVAEVHMTHSNSSGKSKDSFDSYSSNTSCTSKIESIQLRLGHSGTKSLALPHDDAMTPDMKVDWKRALYSQPRNTGKDHDDSLVETDALTSKALKVRRTKWRVYLSQVNGPR